MLLSSFCGRITVGNLRRQQYFDNIALRDKTRTFYPAYKAASMKGRFRKTLYEAGFVWIAILQNISRAGTGHILAIHHQHRILWKENARRGRQQSQVRNALELQVRAQPLWQNKRNR